MEEIEEIFATITGTDAQDLKVCRDGEVDACNEHWIPKDFDCLRSLMNSYTEHCGPYPHYANNFIKYLVRECEQPTMTRNELELRLGQACGSMK